MRPLAMLLAAGLFPGRAQIALPDVQRVAVVNGAVVAVAGDGSGTVFRAGFAVAGRFSAAHNPSSLAVADVDGDGHPDLVVGHHEEKFATVLFGPAYVRAVRVQVPMIAPHVHSVAAADLDGDGHVDLVFNDMGGKRVLVLWGRGDGTFSEAQAVETGSKGFAYFDVAVIGPRLFVPSWPQPEIAVLRARGRTVAREAIVPLPNPAFFAIAAGPDVAVATYSGNAADTSRDGVVLLRGGQVLAHAAGPSPVRLAAGDVDGDGVVDVAVCNAGGNVQVLLGGKGGLRDGETLPAQHPDDVALGDVDGDGKADLVVAAKDEVLMFLTRAR